MHKTILASLFLLLIIACPGLFAAGVNALRSQITEENHSLDKLRQQINHRAGQIQQATDTFPVPEVSKTTLENAKLVVESLHLKLQSLQLDQQAAVQSREKNILLITDRESTLTAMTEHSPEHRQLLQTLETQRQRVTLAADHIQQLQKHIKRLDELLILETRWYQSLQSRYQKQSETLTEQTLITLQAETDQLTEQHLQQISRLRKQLSGIAISVETVDARRLLETEIKWTEDSIFLAKSHLQRVQLSSKLAHTLQLLTADTLSTDQLERLNQSSQQQGLALEANQGLTEKKSAILAAMLELIDKRLRSQSGQRPSLLREKQWLESLIGRFQAELSALQTSIEIAQKTQQQLAMRYETSRQKNLLARIPQPFSHPTRQTLLTDIAQIPAHFSELVKAITNTLRLAWQQAHPSQLSSVILVALMWFWFWIRMSRWLQRLQPIDTDTEVSSSQLLLLLNHQLKKNRYGLLLLGGGFLYSWILQTDARLTTLVATIALLWFICRLSLGFADDLMRQCRADTADWQPMLYRWFKWTLLTMPVLLLLLMLGHYELWPKTIQDLLYWLLAVCLCIVFAAAIRVNVRLTRWVFSADNHINHWLKMACLADLLGLLALLGCALLGVIGYINLAWVSAKYFAFFIAIACAWYVVRTLLIDLNRWLKGVVVKHSKIGLFWAQGIIDPLHWLLRAGLLVLSFYLLFSWYGFDAESRPVVALKAGLAYPLFSVGAVTISLQRILLTLFAITTVVMCARWVRTFSFRWLYAGVRDFGMRHSLSVFTQYFFVTSGLLIALRVMRVDLTSITILTGAIGVGIGFGMQGLANNFISGLLLLLERPLRTNDWVTINNIQGEVKNLGIRSVTITTWDNQDVIIPNANLTSAPFTNWTHQDNIMRRLLAVGISYHADPHLAQKTIMAAIVRHAAVLSHPEPRVLLSQFASSSVDFRIEYHINVRKHCRFAVKSEILFAIWDALKQAGIEIPFPQQDVYIKALPDQRDEPSGS